jgi:glutathione S-transferase
MELFQAEWCPHSHKVRQRLSELGLDFTARQVPADPDDRTEMKAAVGTDEIPVLVSDGKTICGEDDILEHLAGFHDRDDAAEHRQKAHEEVPTFDEVKS